MNNIKNAPPLNKKFNSILKNSPSTSKIKLIASLILSSDILSKKLTFRFYIEPNTDLVPIEEERSVRGYFSKNSEF